MPYCCLTLGSDAVASIFPYSNGKPVYWFKFGRMLDAAVVLAGKVSGAPARTVPFAAGIDTVVSFDARHISLHQSFASNLAALDGVVNVRDRGFFELKLTGSRSRHQSETG
jgi:hypothetical protein